MGGLKTTPCVPTTSLLSVVGWGGGYNDDRHRRRTDGAIYEVVGRQIGEEIAVAMQKAETSNNIPAPLR